MIFFNNNNNNKNRCELGRGPGLKMERAESIHLAYTQPLPLTCDLRHYHDVVCRGRACDYHHNKIKWRGDVCTRCTIPGGVGGGREKESRIAQYCIEHRRFFFFLFSYCLRLILHIHTKIEALHHGNTDQDWWRKSVSQGVSLRLRPFGGIPCYRGNMKYMYMYI